MYKILASLLFIYTTFAIANDDSYIFEAKGEFAKELKSLVEKYSKEGKIEAKVYKKENIAQSESKTITQTVLSVFSQSEKDTFKYADIKKGEVLYKKRCTNCHGLNADVSSYNNARVLKTIPLNEILENLENYRSDPTFGHSTKLIMNQQAGVLSSPDMQSIAVYIYSLNHDTKLPTSEESTQVEDNDEKPSTYLQ